MPSIRKRGNNYQIVVSLGRDIDGRKLIKTTTYTPKASGPKAIEKEVNAFAYNFEKRVKEGEYLSGEKMSFKKYVELHWKDEYAEERLKDHGAQYLDIITKYAYPQFGNMPISKITPEQIRPIYAAMKKKGLSPATIRKSQVAINSVFQLAEDNDTITKNPCRKIKLPKMEEGQKVPCFTPDQAERFLNFLSAPYTETKKGHDRVDDTGKSYHVSSYEVTKTLPLQHQVYFNLAIYGGFRRGELCALTWKDVDFKNNTISINKAIARRKNEESGAVLENATEKSKKNVQIIKDPKTKSGKREVPLPSFCMDLLRKWQREEYSLRLKLGTAWKGPDRPQDFYIFIQEDGALVDITSIRRRFLEIIKRYNKTCKNENDKLPEIRLHGLRHTCASVLAAEGYDYASIAYIMGHHDGSVAYKIYVHPTPENVKKAPEILERAIRKHG